jgi:hypothetical protein
VTAPDVVSVRDRRTGRRPRAVFWNLFATVMILPSRVPASLLGALIGFTWANAWADTTGDIMIVTGLSALMVALLLTLASLARGARRMDFSATGIEIRRWVGLTTRVPWPSVFSIRPASLREAIWEGWYKTLLIADAPDLTYNGERFHCIEWIKPDQSLGVLFFAPRDEAALRGAVARWAPNILDLDPDSEE